MKKVDLMNSLNTSNIVSEGIIDLFSKSVKDRSGVESSMKMLDKFKDKLNINELLVKSALHKNTELIKYVIETYQINVDNEIMINPTILVKSEESNKSVPKDNLALVNIPLIILSAISGNIELLDYLILNKADLKQTGHICISHKKKNSVISNIIGAAAYYGHHDFISHLLELKQVKESNNFYNNTVELSSKTLKNKSYTNELSVNFKSHEKKLKTSKTSQFTREMTGLTPIMLAALNEENHDSAFSIYLQLKSISIVDEVDCDGNNILHLATKASNEKLVRELISEENFNFKEQNSIGETPYFIANNLNNISICNYLASLEKSEEYIEKNIYSLMEEDNKNQQKGKKKKKKNKEETVGIGVSNFVEKNPLNPKKNEVVVTTKTDEKKEDNTDNEIDKAFDPNAASDDDYYDENDAKKNNPNTTTQTYDKNYNTFDDKGQYSNNYYSKYEQDSTYYENNPVENEYDYYGNSYNYTKGQKQGYSNYNYNYNNKGYNYNNQFTQPKTTTYQTKGSFNKGKYYNNYNTNNTYSRGGKEYYQNPNSQRNHPTPNLSNNQVFNKVVKKESGEVNKSNQYSERKEDTKQNTTEQHSNDVQHAINSEVHKEEITELSNSKKLSQEKAITSELKEKEKNTENNERQSELNDNEDNEYDNEKNNTDNSINKLIVDDAMKNINIVNEQDIATNTNYLESLIVSFLN